MNLLNRESKEKGNSVKRTSIVSEDTVKENSVLITYTLTVIVIASRIYSKIWRQRTAMRSKC